MGLVDAITLYEEGQLKMKPLVLCAPLANAYPLVEIIQSAMQVGRLVLSDLDVELEVGAVALPLRAHLAVVLQVEEVAPLLQWSAAPWVVFAELF